MATGKPGPTPTNLSSEERAEFLRLLRGGVGKWNAIRRMGVGWERLTRTLKADRQFRREVEGAREELIERLEALRLTAAINGDVGAQEYLINRHDRSKQFTANMRLRRKQLKLAEGLIHEQSLEELDRLDDGEGSGDSAAAEG